MDKKFEFKPIDTILENATDDNYSYLKKIVDHNSGCWCIVNSIDAVKNGTIEYPLRIDYDNVVGINYWHHVVDQYNDKECGDRSFKYLHFDCCVRYIGDHAFEDNYFVSVVFDSPLEYIGDYAFYHSPYLSSLSIPNSVLYIGKYAFSNSYFECIKLSNNLSCINEGTFSNTWINHITIPESVKEIKDKAFLHTKLKSVYIEGGVKRIGKQAFADNRNLCIVIIDGEVEYIENDAFDDCYEKLIIFGSCEFVKLYATKHHYRYINIGMPNGQRKQNIDLNDLYYLLLNKQFLFQTEITVWILYWQICYERKFV